MELDTSASSSLIRSLKVAERDAWQRLAELYGPLVYAWCRQAGLAESDTADVAQNVFLSVFRSIRHFHRDRPGDSFRGWLWTVTRNEVLKFLRWRAKEPRAAGGTDAHRVLQELPEFLAAEDAPSSTGTQALLVRRAIVSLRDEFQPQTWQAFWRTAMDGHNASEVADELAMTPVAVRQAKFRVLKRLRDYLAEDWRTTRKGV